MILTRDELLKASRLFDNTDAVKRSAADLPAFLERQSNPFPHQRQFLATFAMMEAGSIFPIGLHVKRFDDELLVGDLVANDHWGSILAQDERVPISCIFDWRYIDCFELRGGAVLRYLGDRLTGEKRRMHYDRRSDFCLDAFPSSTPPLREFCFGIAHHSCAGVLASMDQLKTLPQSHFRAPWPSEFSGKELEFGAIEETSSWQWCAGYGNRPICEMLLKSDSRAINSEELDGMAWAAITCRNAETLKWIADQFQFTFERPESLPPFIHLSASLDPTNECLKVLADVGVSLETKDDQNKNALFSASTVAACRYLLANGVKAAERDTFGRTSAEYHRENDRLEISRFLETGVSTCDLGNPSMAARNRVMEKGVLELASYLLKQRLNQANESLESRDFEFGFVLPVEEL